MWLGAIKLAVQAGSHIYKKKQQTKMLMADAQMRHAQKMSSGSHSYFHSYVAIGLFCFL